MQEVVLVVCAVAGVATAMLLRRRSGRGSPGPYTEKDRLSSERDILLKSISKLEEDPSYAAERKALLPSYKSRLREIEAALAGDARPKSARKEDVVPTGAVAAGSLPDAAEPAKAETKEGEVVAESAVAGDTSGDARDDMVAEDVQVEADVAGGGEIVAEDVQVEADVESVEADVESVEADVAAEAGGGEIVAEDVQVEADVAGGAEAGTTPETVAADDKPDIEQVVDAPPVQSPSSEEVQETSKPAVTAPKVDEPGRTEPAEPQDAPAAPKADKPGPSPEDGTGDKPSSGAGPDGDEDDGVDPDEDNLEKIKGDIMKALSKLERAEAD